MSDISIPGVSSKYNTTKLVEDLVEAERIRLTRMETQVETYETTRSTWRQLNREMGDLQRATKSLYGFENPFSEKNANSSDERILTAVASRTAPFDSYSITVKQIATADRFMTPSLARDYRMQAGTYTFSIGEETLSLRYRGGSVSDFARRLSDKGEGLIRATTVRDTTSTQVLMIEAIPTGSENRLVFEDDSIGFGIETGMMRPAVNNDGNVTLSKSISSATTVEGNPAREESFVLSAENLRVLPSSSLRLPFDSTTNVEEGMVLEYKYRTVEIPDDELRPQVSPGPTWPETPDASYGGLTVESAPSTFDVPAGETWIPPERVDSWNIFSVEGGSGESSLPAIQQSPDYKVVRIEASVLPSNVSSLLVNNENTHRSIEVKDIRLFNPARQGNLEPVNAAGSSTTHCPSRSRARAEPDGS